MTRQIRIVPAALSAGIVLFGFGYLAVGRSAVDAPVSAPAVIESTQAANTSDIAEVVVVARRDSFPLSDETRG